MGLFFKFFITVLIVGLMTLGFWMAVYQPKRAEIVSLKQQIDEEQVKYEEYRQEAENLAKWEEAKVAFQKVLESLHQTAPIKDFVPSFLTDIEGLAKEERKSTHDPSFRVTSISPGAVEQAGKEKKPGAAPPPVEISAGKTVVQLNLTGRFNTIVDFLQQLGNFKLNKLVTIQRITFSPQGTAVGLSPTLTVTMPFEVYMLGGG